MESSPPHTLPFYDLHALGERFLRTLRFRAILSFVSFPLASGRDGFSWEEATPSSTSSRAHPVSHGGAYRRLWVSACVLALPLVGRKSNLGSKGSGKAMK